MYTLRYAVVGRGKEGEVYSCDKIQLVFRLKHGTAQQLLDVMASAAWMEFDHWESRKFNSYRNQFSIKVGEHDSFWLGVGLMQPGKARPDDACKLEANPNKVYPSRQFCWMLEQLWQRVRAVDPCTVKQWDLAVDWPGKREDFSLVKDARLYEEVARSRADRTQYVGQRNKPGRCKLYNKQIEADLTEPWTRLEITVDGVAGLDDVRAVWPTVYRLADVQINGEMAALTDTDRFIFATLLERPDRLPELGRRKRQRMQELLDKARYMVAFDEAAYKPVSAFVMRLAQRPARREDGLDRAAWEWQDRGGVWVPEKEDAFES